MNKSTLTSSYYLFIILFWVFPMVGLTQQTAVADTNLQKVENYREQIKRLMGFLEFSLNTLGSSETSTREKEIIINESYMKAFLHEEVQIEDDLDENREILTYKDVQAYLKDVDFFFKEAEFNFDVADIQSLKNDRGMTYFKVTANRNLKAVTVSDTVISNNKTRYIEINLDEEEQVLKIASIYTTRLNEAQEMMDWWNGMSSAWKMVLGAEFKITEELSLSHVDFLNDTTLLAVSEVLEVTPVEKFIHIGEDSLLIIENDTVLGEVYDTIAAGKNNGLRILKELTQREILDVQGNMLVKDLYPVSQMTELKSLNISGTLITDLFPARNLNNLESLNISGTGIFDLTPIRYNTKIRELCLDQTPVQSLAPIQEFTALEILHFNRARVDSLNDVSRLANLKDLRFDNTGISDLGPLDGLISLENLSMAGARIDSLNSIQYLVTLKRINFENTAVTDLTPLARLESLQFIDADSTLLDDLEPVGKLPALEKVYCNNTRITASLANAFMASHPNILVIYESEALTEWWANLNLDWQKIFRHYNQMDETPNTEQLHLLTLLDSISIENNQNITSLEPLVKLTNLKEVNANATLISDLIPLADLIDLRILYCSKTRVSDLTPLEPLGKLEILDFSQTLVESLQGLESLNHLQLINVDGTGVDDLSTLIDCKDLQIVYCDNTKIGKVDIDKFNDGNPDCLVIYQTSLLKNWWSGLPVTWKTSFRAHTQLDEPPTREQLHALAALTSLDLSGLRGITSLDPLTMLHRLEELNLANGTMQDISPLRDMVRLKKLNLSGNPVEDITPLSSLPALVNLDISNTAISELDALENLISLEELNCSGTQIKKPDPLSSLFNLKKIECFNTGINNLKPLLGLVKLKQLICYNTKLNQKKVDAFKESMPGLEVVFY